MLPLPLSGGNSGIGKQLASFLLQKGATVYIGSRSPKKSGDVFEELERKVTRGGAVRILSMDLADLRSVKHAAEEFKSYVLTPSINFSRSLTDSQIMFGRDTIQKRRAASSSLQQCRREQSSGVKSDERWVRHCMRLSHLRVQRHD